MKFRLTLDLMTTIAELVGAGLIVSGIAVLLGVGAGLIAAGVAIFALSFLASVGTE